MKILLINFGAYGDILNSTPIAKHYKIEHANNHITWMTREKYKSAVKNNPYIDDILIPKEKHLYKNGIISNVEMTFVLREEILNLKNKFDKMFFIAPYVWTLTSEEFDVEKHSLLYVIKNKLTDISNFNCEFIPIVNLSDDEKKEAKQFISSLKGEKRIMIEHENFSNQTPFDETYIEDLCKKIDGKNYDLIFSGKEEPIYVKHLKEKYNVNFYCYSGSFMSNAELYNLCDVFIGCCSGLTCLTHSDYCDREKFRLEISNGPHWSSIDWTHMKNKKISFSKEQYKKDLENII
jgi:ADP-heptose:LPS heptosyltransferase